MMPYTYSNGRTENMEFTMWAKDGMAWLRELVQDPMLADEWTWYPFRKTVYCDGASYRILDDPMSANNAWDYQVWVYFRLYWS